MLLLVGFEVQSIVDEGTQLVTWLGGQVRCVAQYTRPHDRVQLVFGPFDRVKEHLCLEVAQHRKCKRLTWNRIGQETTNIWCLLTEGVIKQVVPSPGDAFQAFEDDVAAARSVDSL
jgi:hypothetical protein